MTASLQFKPTDRSEFALDALYSKIDAVRDEKYIEAISFSRSGAGKPQTLVRDGVIEKMFIEPEEPGDPYEVSDADTMLRYLAPDDAVPLDVTVFTRNGCPHCARAKGLLRDAGIEFEELRLNREYTDQTLRAVAAATSVPQVFIGGEHVGGADELEQWLSKNERIVRKAAA